MNPGPTECEAEVLTTWSRNLYGLFCPLARYRYRLWLHHLEMEHHLSTGADSIDLFNRCPICAEGNLICHYLVTFIIHKIVYYCWCIHSRESQFPGNIPYASCKWKQSVWRERRRPAATAHRSPYKQVKFAGVESSSVKVKPLLNLIPVGCSDNPLNLYLGATRFKYRPFIGNSNWGTSFSFSKWVWDWCRQTGCTFFLPHSYYSPDPIIPRIQICWRNSRPFMQNWRTFNSVVNAMLRCSVNIMYIIFYTNNA
jgi:hypothetical protein